MTAPAPPQQRGGDRPCQPARKDAPPEVDEDCARAVQQAEVRGIETTLGSDDQPDSDRGLGDGTQDRGGALTDDAREDACVCGQLAQRVAQREYRVHLWGRGPTGQLRRLPGDQPPALEPVDDPRRIGAGHCPVGEHGPDRCGACLGERLDGRVHRLRRHGLQHVDLEAGLTLDRPAPDDRAAHP
jgi:hypothetical protein